MQQTNPTATILVVDDEADLLELARLILVREGFRVLTKRDAPAALRLLEESTEAIALVVTDVQMPEMGGEEFARVVRERWPKLPILFISACSPNELEKRGVLDFGAPVIRKPFRKRVFLSAVRNLLGLANEKSVAGEGKET